MAWMIKAGPQIQEFIDGLSDDEQHKARWVLERLQHYGLDIGKTSWAAYIDDGLWELRVRWQRVWIRFFYFRSGANEFTIVHAYKKKSNRTPKKVRDYALKQMRQLKER